MIDQTARLWSPVGAPELLQLRILGKRLKEGCCIVHQEALSYLHIVRVIVMVIATAIVISVSDSDRGVDSDSDIDSTSNSHIDSDGHSDCDNVVISDGESDNNSYRHSYYYSDSEGDSFSLILRCGSVRKFGFIVLPRRGAMQSFVFRNLRRVGYRGSVRGYFGAVQVVKNLNERHLIEP